MEVKGAAAIVTGAASGLGFATAAALAKAPQASVAPPALAEPKKEPNRFEAAMDKAGNPQVGADGGPAAEGGGGDADPTSRILANYRAATGAKPKAA